MGLPSAKCSLAPLPYLKAASRAQNSPTGYNMYHAGTGASLCKELVLDWTINCTKVLFSTIHAFVVI